MTDETRQSPTKTMPHTTDRATIARVAELLEKMKSSPIGMSEPWECQPSGGKPLLYGRRCGLLAYGTVATWTEFDLIVAVINALPALPCVTRPGSVGDGYYRARAARAQAGIVWTKEQVKADSWPRLALPRAGIRRLRPPHHRAGALHLDRRGDRPAGRADPTHRAAGVDH
jgi:hypothetical protein